MKLLSALAIVSVLTGCAAGTLEGPRAAAQLRPTAGNTASGTATFTQSGSKVLVVAQVSGLKPNAEHGFHVHEKGDCSSGDGMSTGGHFNPGGRPHGAPAAGQAHHAGDLPALKADASGNASFTYESDDLAVADGPASVVGRGLIVHADPDDYKTQPTGNSGARIACAVIQKG
jgi:superoxide dismutase, Cu-Zn family